MGLAEDDDMVQALSSDRTDEALNVSVLPGRSRCRWSVTDAHGREASRYGVTIGGVPVADQILGRFIPRERFCDLLRDPLRRRMLGHAQRDQASSFMPSIRRQASENP